MMATQHVVDHVNDQHLLVQSKHLLQLHHQQTASEASSSIQQGRSRAGSSAEQREDDRRTRADVLVQNAVRRRLLVQTIAAQQERELGRPEDKNGGDNKGKGSSDEDEDDPQKHAQQELESIRTEIETELYPRVVTQQREMEKAMGRNTELLEAIRSRKSQKNQMETQIERLRLTLERFFREQVDDAVRRRRERCALSGEARQAEEEQKAEQWRLKMLELLAVSLLGQEARVLVYSSSGKPCSSEQHGIRDSVASTYLSDGSTNMKAASLTSGSVTIDDERPGKQAIKNEGATGEELEDVISKIVQPEVRALPSSLRRNPRYLFLQRQREQQALSSAEKEALATTQEDGLHLALCLHDFMATV
ncbi:unnamed protein product [Amoebophrya sp. A25]|nr:unnamed protein product [Amoebophrya sp. A25]|eukprot:GSA25T00016632001.1